MARLLEEETQAPRNLRRGGVADGVVMRVDRDSILVDIGAKTEGVIPSYEMRSLSPAGLSQMKVGDEVLVYILGQENSDGQPVLSLDRAQEEKGWRQVQRLFEAGESLEAKIISYNRGGLLVDVMGIAGFVPQSQLLPQGGEGEASLAQRVGQVVSFKIIEVNRRRNRLILSEREARQALRAQQKARLIAEIKEGEVRRGKVAGIHPFGAFIDLGGADGLVPASELSWDRVEGPAQVLELGQEVEVYVMRVDPESKKIALSLRRAQPQPWDHLMGRYREGQLVQGTITRLTAFGAFARIEGSVEGLIHISELADRRVNHPKEVVKEGEVLTLKILRIEPERHRLGLSLKQAQGEAPGGGEPPYGS